MKKFYLLLGALFLLTFFACKNENQSPIKKHQIYVSSESNPNTQEPFHEVWTKKDDTLWKHDFWKNEKSYAVQELGALKQNDELVFSNQDTRIKIDNFTLYKNLHFFGNNSSTYSYVKTQKGQAIQAEELIQLGENRFFETSLNKLKTPNSNFQIQEKISFTKDSISYFWDYFYADELMYTETETVALSFFEVEDQLFLIPSTQENRYPIYQVVKADEAELELAYFIDFETKIKHYKTTNNFNLNNYTPYQLCKDSFQSLYSVGDDVRYAKGLDHLLAYLQEGAPKTEGEGFINIHFTINCNGDVGRFGLELLNKNYQSTNFDPQLIKHIVDKVKQIDDFTNVEKIDYKGAKDVKAFFLIQIANQQIVEVCP